MSSPQETFSLECDELLTAMEDALLNMEDNADDPEYINSIFRAAHTIKGTSGVFGFDDVEAFTHVVENVLDEVRNGNLAIDSDLVAILLLCRDHIELLVNAAVEEQEIEQEAKQTDAELRSKLEKYLAGEPADKDTEVVPAEPKVEVESAGQLVSTDNWHISLRLDKDVLENGMDPLAFFRYLGKLGEIVNVITLTDNLPDFESYNPEHCYLGFEIDLLSAEDKTTIENVFEFVQEMCILHILPPRANIELYHEVIKSLPEEDMRIGEILVACGALTEHELVQALAWQKIEVQERKSANDPVPPIGEVIVEQQMVPKEIVDAALEKQTKVKENKISGNRVLRVDAEKLDSLINLVGELVIAGATTNMLVQKIADEQLTESMSGISHLVEEIRDNALNLRMVQIGETFTRFKRVVRDMSKELGKDIRLNISGADTELDKTVVEKIGDPLMHLVRNAIDHGIESSAERKASGKPEQGNLTLNAYHDSGSIVIEVVDDGLGLSRDKILAKAMEKELITEGQVLTDNEIYRMIFEAGFSTAEQVTNLSGRGVGMDVVRRNIEALRGTIDIESERGQGTVIRIRLPLTLAIIDGFLVRVGDSSYVIPLDMVHECIELDDNEQDGICMQGYINLRGEVLPFLRLSDYFNENATSTNRESIVVVQYGNQKAGFVVDELLGELQTVIKPMGKILQNVKGVSGATILGSGNVAVILDVPNLVGRATKVANSLSGSSSAQTALTLH